MKRFGYYIIFITFIVVSIVSCDNPITDLVKLPEIGISTSSIELRNGDSINLGSVAADGAGGDQGDTAVVDISNFGNEELEITSVVISSGDSEDFYLSPNFSSPVLPGKNTSISISFDPSSQGELDVVVSIGSNDKNNNPLTFTATGIGLSAGTVSAPTFSPAAGTYSTEQDILLSCSTDKSNIYYTLDGSDPSENSIKYSGSITLDETTNIKAIAIRQGWDDSAIAMAQYILQIEYDLVFEPNGGTGTMLPQAIIHGESETIDNNAFTREGYVFIGWAIDANGDVLYGDQDLFTMTERGEVLWAIWEENAYVVHFEPNGGTGTMADQPISFGSSEVLNENTFSRIGHDFIGWANSSGGSTVYSDGDTFFMSTEGSTLWAKWTANQYSLSFDPNGATGTMDSQQFTFGETAAINLNGFVMNGYSFSGWSETLGGAVRYGNGASFTMNTEGASIYAEWTPNLYDIEFFPNNGSGFMTSQSVAFDSTETLDANTYYRTGYDFIGWATSSDGPLVYTDEDDFTMNTFGAELYAVWEIQSYEVVFDTGEGSSVANQTVDYNELVVEPEDPESLYYTFSGWYSEVECINEWDFSNDQVIGSLTLYAKWILAYSVGSEGPTGGTIFYENPNYDPEDPNDWRYMEGAADSLIAFNLVSQSPAEDILGADGTAIGTGLQNTIDVVNMLGTSYEYGARYCYELSITVDGKVYDDWFLPSIDEVIEMTTICGMGGTPMNIQISSSEYSTTDFNSFMFMGAVSSHSDKTSSSDFMFFRPTRRF